MAGANDFKQQACWYTYRDGDAYVHGWYDDDRSWAAKLDWSMARMTVR